MFPPQIQRIRIGRRTISPCQTRIAERSYRTPLGTVTRVKIPPVHKEVIRHWMVAQMSLTDDICGPRQCLGRLALAEITVQRTSDL
jgi:hypothetical protein